MRIYGKGSLLRKAICCLAFASFAWSSIEVQADSWGGSWGGRSGGSWGGSGGYGSGGGLYGGHRPIRNLLGRIGGRFSGGSYGSGGSGGSWGGSTGYGSHGSLGHSHASSGGYGSMGSVGSSYGSVGSSYGSVGSSYGSVQSFGSVGTSYVSTGSIGSVGMSYGAMPATSYGSYSAPVSSGEVIYDSGYAPSIPHVYDSTNPSMAPGANGLQPVPGIYYEGGSGSPTPANPPSNAPSSGTDFSPPPVSPSKPDGSTSIIPDRETVLSLRVPTDAQVYINDHKTKTKGDVRRYVSRNLETGREYYYHVKAVVVRNGKTIERNELVSLKAGEAQAIAFDFEQSVTSLALNVPANAKVTLCGKKTNASGDSRHFSTTKLEPGQVWNDYTIEVALESNGKVIRQEKKINMIGGESHQLTFEFDAAKEMLAVR